MKHLKSIALTYKGLMCLYVAMGLAAAFLQSFGARYFQKVIDSFTANTLTFATIAVYGGAIIAVYIICYLQNYPERKLEHGIELSLKTRALQKTSVIDYSSYIKMGTGALIQRIENGAAAGTSILFGFYLRLAGELLPAMLFSVGFIFAINRTVMAAILLGYMVVFIITNILLRALYKVKAHILINEEKFNHFLVRGLMEMVVFRLHRRFAAEIQKAEAASREIIGSKVKMKLIHEAFFTIFVIIVGILKIGILLYGWLTKALTIGEIVALLALVENAYLPIAIFNVCYVQYKLDGVAFARYTAFLDAKEDARLTQGKAIPAIKGCITFSEVSFCYNERTILDGFCLDIEPGTSTAFVGESGSGKSTAAKLLAGLLQPHAGHIKADGFDLSDISLHSYYGHIAYLPQEPSVFNGTLRENLVFDEAVDDEALLKAIRQTGLANLYTKLADGLDTPLGERGISLSGGERQQLALARLWFTNANLVILDEATSAIDNLTEEAVMANVLTHLTSKTVLAIAHRLDSVRAFDRIVVFQNGRIVEQGGFDELLGRHQNFHELYYRTE